MCLYTFKMKMFTPPPCGVVTTRSLRGCLRRITSYIHKHGTEHRVKMMTYISTYGRVTSYKNHEDTTSPPPLNVIHNSKLRHTHNIHSGSIVLRWVTISSGIHPRWLCVLSFSRLGRSGGSSHWNFVRCRRKKRFLSSLGLRGLGD